MSITQIIFTLSFALFIAYTVVSLAFLNKKRSALQNELHNLVTNEMTDCFGRITPDQNTALQLLRKMDAQFQQFHDDSYEIHVNIIKLSLLTAGIGICAALNIILF